ncbi:MULTISPECIES: hypothetical protein [Geodermatophilus]|uniref:DUF2188 domain-containing protein n=1 Tax=Geodermatophilus arenarius TaxID=1137990 RepID=A0ABV9LJ01_9ACTN
MDFRRVRPGQWHRAARIEITEPGGLPTAREVHERCHVLFTEGWCWVETSDGSIDVYPAYRVRAAHDLREADQADEVPGTAPSPLL